MQATRNFHPGPIGPSLLALALALAISQAHPAHAAVIAQDAGAPAAELHGRALAVATSTGSNGVRVSSRVATSSIGEEAAIAGAGIVDAGGNAAGSYRLGSVDAQPFFSDHAQATGSLEGGHQDLLLTADVTFDGPGSFGFQPVLATAVPEPESWMTLVFGLGLVLVAARRPAQAGGRRFADGEGIRPGRMNFTAFA